MALRSDAPAPVADPLSYPGESPASSILLLSQSPSESPRLDLPPGRRVGQARLTCSSRAPIEARSSSTLNTALRRLNQIDVNHRIPMVAYGSNANVAQLMSKFADYPDPAAIPMVKATIGGLSVAYSAHLSKYAYIPATLITRPGATADVFVLFLDDAELEHVSTSEPNYWMVKFEASQHLLELDSGERLGSYYVYVSRHGVLHLEGRPMYVTASPGSQTVIQKSLLANLAVHPDLSDLPQEPLTFVERVRADVGLLERVSRILREQYSLPMFPQRPTAAPKDIVLYGATRSTWRNDANNGRCKGIPLARLRVCKHG